MNGNPAIARFGTRLLLVALLGGCAQPPLRPGADNPAQVTNSINLSGFPPEYRRGFSAGCADAGRTSRRDSRHRLSTSAFVNGWQDGVDYCRTRKGR